MDHLWKESFAFFQECWISEIQGKCLGDESLFVPLTVELKQLEK